MGNDGSSISKVKTLLTATKRRSSGSQNSESRTFDSVSRWSICRLSNAPLQPPVVSDYRGNLFNKESILEWLLTPHKEDYSDDQVRLFGHIKTLKDVIELHNIVEVEVGDKGSVLKCDVGDEIWGKSSGKFSYLAPCGDVVPRRTLGGDQCAACSVQYKNTDVIALNPSAEELSVLEKRMAKLKSKGLTHSGKPVKTKKRKANPQDDTEKSPKRQNK
ncbi:LAFA_0F01134g1_1 [Lachancea sp. 'fantastica']|nr:LAFA_0F01134g1_1 [Lachancea sp. 'fantastica']